MRPTRLLRPAAVLAAAFMLCSPVPAQDENTERKTWSDTAELSLVGTDGNSESLTFGFKNDFEKNWDKSVLEVDIAGIRTRTTNVTRRGFDDPNIPGDDFTLIEEEDTQTTAETYLVRTRYQRDITERFFWYGAVSWDRNRPAGIQNRYTYIGGVGNIWRDTDDLKFKTDYAATYTDQEDVVDNPEQDETFVGFRFSWDYLNRWTATTVYENKLVVDQNLDESDDLRANMSNGLTVTMSEKLALKAGLTFLYDAEPSFESVDVFPDVDGDGASLRQQTVQLDELDTIYSLSLVVNF